MRLLRQVCGYVLLGQGAAFMSAMTVLRHVSCSTAHNTNTVGIVGALLMSCGGLLLALEGEPSRRATP